MKKLRKSEKFKISRFQSPNIIKYLLIYDRKEAALFNVLNQMS